VKEYDRIGGIQGIHKGNFEKVALDVFRFQYHENELYRRFCDLLHRHPGNVASTGIIPFLPISFFKSHEVMTTSFIPEVVFESSGTTGSQTSRHFVKRKALYETSFISGFENRYGAVADWCIMALLPAYLERQHSSLVYMADRLIRDSHHPKSGFYLYNQQELAGTLSELEAAGQPTLLLGVTFALLDFAEACPMPLKHTLIMETGGMKGRKEEITREAVHEKLCNAFQLKLIHSEYGMTELLSQAYSGGGGRFQTPPWMQVLIREEDDPLAVYETGPAIRSGAANIIDLANLYSCAFIATDDAARLHPDGSFEILGRLDHSDIRGCSLLAV